MDPVFTVISPSSEISFPHGWIGWSGFITLAVAALLLLWKWQAYNLARNPRRLTFFLLLLALTPFTSLFIGFRLPLGEPLSVSWAPIAPTAPVVMVFSAIPWAIAGGLLGPAAAAFLAFISGIFTSFWLTHSLFTPIEYCLLAILFSAAVRQKYRTPTYSILRHPLAATILASICFAIIHLFTLITSSEGSLVNRLDYSLQSLPNQIIAIGIELFLVGLLLEAFFLIYPTRWVEKAPLVPSPSEKSLQRRFTVSMAPLALALLLALMVGNWIVAGNAAQKMIYNRMASAAQTAAQTVPYFLGTGQHLITKLVENPNLLSDDPAVLTEILNRDIKAATFFSQLSIIAKDGNPIISYPTYDKIGAHTQIEEQYGIIQAFNGIPFQTFSIPPSEGYATAQISFMATIFDRDNRPQRVLIGRSNLTENPFSQSIISSLHTVIGNEDIGILMDENGRILVHPDRTMVMTTYMGKISDEPLEYSETLPNGTRMLVYYQPAIGRPWSIVLMVPAYRVHELALQIATPLLAMILVISLLALIVLRFGLRMVTSSLDTLAHESGRIAQGRLDQPLSVDGIDEVGQLRRAFEQMRLSLKSRLDELNRLLMVSQGVASSLEMSEAVQPVLEAALATGASSARVVLTPEIMTDLDGAPSIPLTFGFGPSHSLYCDLDEQILSLSRQHERLVLSNLFRPRLLNLSPGKPQPSSLLAVALHHENLYFGSLWIAFSKPHTFSEEEVRFMVTLGSQAALAAANARLFLTAEIGRQRLESILASNPDPVLVTNQHDQLLLTNPAAWQVLGLSMEETNYGQLINQVIKEPELVNILKTTNIERQSVEISLPDGRIYQATATPVLAEGQRIGRVCVLRDVTHFKELDTLKSDFVSTVSHDLRSPLTLMRGYATMLEMVGPLNDQQTNYVHKIVTGVETMSRLINNLLDLGRIESGVGLQLEMTNIPEVVERVVSSLQLQAAQKKIQLTTEFPDNPLPAIEVDQALLQQALHNLIENAIKFSRPEGKVHVRLRLQTTGVLFEVIDDGFGISPMDQPHLFEKFFRGAQPGTRDQRSTGLGLAIVKSIAERHGGRAWAESQLGKGSSFYFSLPLHQEKIATTGFNNPPGARLDFS